MEVSYCTEKGIPHSEFLEWDAPSRAKLTAFLLEQAETCQLCGTAGWEWEENRYAYDVEEIFCPGCYRKEISSDGDKLPGTRIELVPVTKELRDKQYILNKRREHIHRERED